MRNRGNPLLAGLHCDSVVRNVVGWAWRSY